MNVTSLFGNLCNVTEFTKEIRRKLTKIDDDLKKNAQKLKLDLSSSSAHYMKIRSLSEMQEKVLKEEEMIRSSLLDIQNMILPIMNTM